MRVVVVYPQHSPIVQNLSAYEVEKLLGPHLDLIKTNGNLFLFGRNESTEYNCTINGRKIMGPVICIASVNGKFVDLNDELVDHYMNLAIFSRQ